MRLRLTKIDEFQFLICLQHELWGSQSARFKNWLKGDKLVFIVDKSLAAIAEVTGKPFKSNDKIWDNGVFPNRIPIKFTHVLNLTNRPPILGEVRDALTQQWGPRYGWAILNQQVLESPNSDNVFKTIASRTNALGTYLQSLPDLLYDARSKRDQIANRKKKKKIPTTPAIKLSSTEPEEEKPLTKRDTSTHTKAQSELITLGKITGCSVWIASNDQSKTFGGKNLIDGCLKKLPVMGLNEDATKRISMIDVIWLNQNAPVCAFEIETTTSIFSGLLRMSDLLAVVPALNIPIYIVAPRERQDKVMSELTRPTFRKIGLSDYCRYISIEDLSDLISKLNGLDGHIQPSILDTIALSLEDEVDQESP